MAGQLPAKVKNARLRRAMLLQRGIAHEIASSQIGRELRLLADQPHRARTESDAPDVDARVILNEPAPVGEFIQRKITGSRGYDLIA
jgi:tRNA A37 methylthiotransferase MiaB